MKKVSQTRSPATISVSQLFNRWAFSIAKNIRFKQNNLADGGGFEPPVRFDPHTRFPSVLLQPLGQPSVRVIIARGGVSAGKLDNKGWFVVEYGGSSVGLVKQTERR